MVKVGDVVLDTRSKEFEVVKIDDRGEFTYFYVKHINDESETIAFGKKAFNEKFTKKENK